MKLNDFLTKLIIGFFIAFMGVEYYFRVLYPSINSINVNNIKNTEELVNNKYSLTD